MTDLTYSGKTETHIELNVHELDIILKALELVENGDEIQINRSSGSLDTLYDRLYDYYVTLDHQTLNSIMNLMLNPLSKRTPITPQTNPELWYSWYAVVKEDAPEVLDQFIENTAAKMELTVDYFTAEFL